MSTIVYQGLQSCLESQLVEPRTLRLRLSSPKLFFSESLESALKSCSLDPNSKELGEKHNHEEISKKCNNSSNPDMGGWSFLQSLSNISQGPKEAMEKETIYIHPLVKRSSSRLSGKSLELCTENLGSETGSDTIETSIFSDSSSDSKGQNMPTREQLKSSQLLGARKANSSSFPPPLTTMSGWKSLQVRSHREDGRLVIQAVEAPPIDTHIQAERSHGRLRLYFSKDYTSNFDSSEENGGNEDNEKEEFENDTTEEEEEEVGEEEAVEEQEEEEEESDAYLDEELDGDSLDVGAEMGMEKFQRPSRCKEAEGENKGMLNWEPCWVATS